MKYLLFVSLFFFSTLALAADPVTGNFTFTTYEDGSGSVVLKGAAAEAIYNGLAGKAEFLDTPDLRAFYKRGDQMTCFSVVNPTQGVECVVAVRDTARGSLR